MIVVIPLVALLHQRSIALRAAGGPPLFHRVVPLFLIGFGGMVLARSGGDVLAARHLVDAAPWARAIGAVSATSTWCLTVAMAGVGLSTNVRRLRALGLRPLALGFAVALAVGSIGAGLVHGLVPGTLPD